MSSMSDRSSSSTPQAQVGAAALRALGASSGRWRRIGGTGWGEAWSLTVGDERHSVKLSSGNHPTMLDCEAEGLRAIEAAGAIRVPEVRAVGAAGPIEFLILEWLDLRPLAEHAALGRALARLHGATPPHGDGRERFGWRRDNWLGGAAQSNAWCDDWCTFFRDRRLRPQFERALARGFTQLERDAERLLGAVPQLLAGHEPPPSLVHGDLWSGNAGSSNGDAVVFDPAVHVGDAEVDLAMTELFGGFGAEFRAAYASERPIEPGYPARRELYNLYHLLNHLNLFGPAYLDRTRRAIRRVLART